MLAMTLDDTEKNGKDIGEFIDHIIHDVENDHQVISMETHIRPYNSVDAMKRRIWQWMGAWRSNMNWQLWPQTKAVNLTMGNVVTFAR